MQAGISEGKEREALYDSRVMMEHFYAKAYAGRNISNSPLLYLLLKR